MAADLNILALKPTGGHVGFVRFKAEIVNATPSFLRVSIEADVDGVPVHCELATLDLPAYQHPEWVRIDVPRPALGALIQAFNNEVTLYGRTLTVTIEAEGLRDSKRWREHVYTDEENRNRRTIQQREWRIGLGTQTPQDDIDDLQAGTQ